jgi:phage/plasmid primase-like uncharacterized protein
MSNTESEASRGFTMGPNNNSSPSSRQPGIPADEIERAKRVPLEEVLALCGITLKGKNHRYGPCPQCNGTDRFSITISNQLWRCRHCAPKGGDAIDLLIHITRCTFGEAVERLTGGVRVPVSHHAKPKPAPRADLTEAERIAKARALWAPAASLPLSQRRWGIWRRARRCIRSRR